MGRYWPDEMGGFMPVYISHEEISMTMHTLSMGIGFGTRHWHNMRKSRESVGAVCEILYFCNKHFLSRHGFSFLKKTNSQI